jgi:subtilase family serine protease
MHAASACSLAPLAPPDSLTDSLHATAARLALSQLEIIAGSVSDPRNVLYGQHMTTDEIAELVAPAPQVRSSLVGFLFSTGVRYRTVGRGDAWSTLVIEELSGTELASLLGTSCASYRRGSDDTAAVLGDLLLPRSLRGSIAAVFGVHELPSSALGESPQPLHKPTAYPVTPQLLRSVYNISNSTVVSRPTASSAAVIEFQSQGVHTDDLSYFFQHYVPRAHPGDENISAYRGDATRPYIHAGSEASLDIDYIMGVAPGVPTEYWSYKSKAVCAGFISWTSDALAMAAPPRVVSLSWGFQGGEIGLEHYGCTPAMQGTIEANHMKLAAAGVTVLHASGDGGSGYPPTTGPLIHNCPILANPSAGGLNGTLLRSLTGLDLPSCCVACTGEPSSCAGFVYRKSSAREGTCELYSHVSGTTAASTSVFALLRDFVRMFPSWPATSPWVTAVGGTEFIGEQPGHGEKAVSAYGSGGGFAVRAPQGGTPAYQASAVESYLTSVGSALPPSFLFNRSNRATPDVSTLGYGFQVRLNGETATIGGTSASAPTFGALVALINDARLAAKKPPLGHLNYLIYQHPDAFTDITVGNNSIGRGMVPLPAGWQCAVGWDPVTGLGTPRFDKLLAVAMAAI